MIAVGFGFAAWLIQSSFSDWSKSPIATTISTHPVSDLDFPEVTICPPEDLNVALKYDLTRLANMTMTTKLKESLRKASNMIFNSGQSEAYFVEERLKLINKGNFRNMFEGYLTTSNDGFTVNMGHTKGTIESPGFGQSFTPQLYREMLHFMDKVITYNLHAGAIKQAINEKGFLRIDMQADVDFESELLFQSFDEYELFENSLSWSDAETFCVSKGGHLASVDSKTEQTLQKNVGKIDSQDGFWLGGKYDNMQGWQWTDKSPWDGTAPYVWGFSQSEYCLFSRPYGINGELYAYSSKCTLTRVFFCKFPKKPVKRTYSLSHDMIGGNITIWMKLKKSGPEYLQKRGRMPGFRLSWSVEEKKRRGREVELRDVGRFVETPFWGEQLNKDWKYSDHFYKATLLMDDIYDQMNEQDKLIIDLTAETGEGRLFAGKGGPTHSTTISENNQHVMYKEARTWEEAEEFCFHKGGHLASVSTEEEWNEIITVIGDEQVWVGGTDQVKEGEWEWIDGTPWNFTKWNTKSGPHKDYEFAIDANCLGIFRQEMRDVVCNSAYLFGFKQSILCEFTNIESVRSGHTIFTFDAYSLPLPSFQVAFYHPKVAVLWNVNTTPGFYLSWHIESSNLSLSKMLPRESEKWKIMEDAPAATNIRLIEAVNFARKARMNGFHKSKLLRLATEKKIKSNILCTGTQMRPCSHLMFKQWLEGLSEDLDFLPGPVLFPNEDDLAIGLEIFYRLTYCSQEKKAAQGFVENLTAEDNLSTLFLGIVNTIQGKLIKEPGIWRGFRDFYVVLERELGLKHGQILLALASTAELEAIFVRDWPYLDTFIKG